MVLNNDGHHLKPHRLVIVLEKTELEKLKQNDRLEEYFKRFFTDEACAPTNIKWEILHRGPAEIAASTYGDDHAIVSVTVPNCTHQNH